MLQRVMCEFFSHFTRTHMRPSRQGWGLVGLVLLTGASMMQPLKHVLRSGHWPPPPAAACRLLEDAVCVRRSGACTAYFQLHVCCSGCKRSTATRPAQQSAAPSHPRSLNSGGWHCRCEYVTSNEACHAEDHYLSYLPSYYCAGGGRIKWLMMPLYLGWMLVLFYALSEVAEGFLVPSVEVRLAWEPGQGCGCEGLTLCRCLQGWCCSMHFRVAGGSLCLLLKSGWLWSSGSTE